MALQQLVFTLHGFSTSKKKELTDLITENGGTVVNISKNVNGTKKKKTLKIANLPCVSILDNSSCDIR